METVSILNLVTLGLLLGILWSFSRERKHLNAAISNYRQAYLTETEHRTKLNEALWEELAENIVLRRENGELLEEIGRHRKFIEAITQNGTEYDEDWEVLQDNGLIVSVPATQHFFDEWCEEEMWVLAWSPLAVAKAKEADDA